MSAVLKNITMPYGDTLPFKVTMENDEAGIPWSSWDEYRLKFTVKNNKLDPDSSALVRKSTDVGGNIYKDGAEAYWEQDTDAGIPSHGAYYYDIQLERTQDPIRAWTFQYGYINLTADVTRA